MSPDPQQLYQQAQSYIDQNQLPQAAAILQQLIQTSPQFTPAYIDLGLIQFHLGHPQQALSLTQTALAQDPHNPIIHNNLGLIHDHLHQHQPAIDHYTQAINLQPQFSPPRFNLANLILDTQPHQTLQLLQPMLNSQPNSPALHKLIGNTHRVLNNFPQAISHLQQSLNHNPQDPQTHYYLAQTYLSLEDYPPAIHHLYQATNLDPVNLLYLSQLLYTHQLTADWNQTHHLHQHLKNLLHLPFTTQSHILPFPFLAHTPNPHTIYQITTKYSQALFPPQSSTHQSPILGKPNIGYLSTDFHRHPTYYLIQQLFPLHSNQLQHHVFSLSSSQTDLSIQNHLHQHSHLTDISSSSIPDITQTISSTPIHILLDLKGHTHQNRHQIFSYRPAPIQVSWLGYPATTGADFIDYFITDSIASPPKHQSYFTEKLVFMPHSYQINSQTPFSHTSPSRPFVISNYNQIYKFNPQDFTATCRLLTQLPHSQLHLMSHNPHAQQTLSQVATIHGASSHQILHQPRLSHTDHLRRLSHSHLALDTIMVNGHTTTSDALLAGVPVVTVLGKHFASRVSASLLLALGLSECITHSLDDYYHLALSLAQSPHKLSRLKRKLIYAQTRYPLFDTKRFVKNLESAYTTMWSIYQAGEKPRSFHITDPLPLDNSYTKHK